MNYFTNFTTTVEMKGGTEMNKKIASIILIMNIIPLVIILSVISRFFDNFVISMVFSLSISIIFGTFLGFALTIVSYLQTLKNQMEKNGITDKDNKK